MVSDLPRLAKEIGAAPRTLRRAVSDGLVRCHRPGPRKLSISSSERRYLIEHWDLLSKLRRVLRTEPRVRLAVLHGSVARGHDDAGSDIDLLVVAPGADLIGLTARLQRRLGRRVDLAAMEDVDPVLLLEAVQSGRVLVDRDRRWKGLVERAPRLERQARLSFERQIRDTAEALKTLDG